MVSPMVWTAAEREGFVADTQAMRRRVLEHIPARDADRQLKLGAGGLRDVEFAVQLLQLVHGRADESIRRRRDAVRAGRPDPRRVRRPRGRRGAARGLRVPAHARAPDPAAPAAPHPRGARGRAVPAPARPQHGLPQGAGRRRSTGPGSTTAARCAGCTRSSSTARCSSAVAKLPGPEVRLSPEAAGERLAALGYADPKAALRHLEALTSGVTRTAAIQRALLPAMLQWFADAPDPDAGLFGFRRLSEALGSTPWYLRTLRDEGQVAERLAHLLATSPLRHRPARARAAGRAHARRDDLVPLTAEAMTEEMLATAGRHEDDAEKAIRAVRGVRRRELLRIACRRRARPGRRRRRRRRALPAHRRHPGGHPRWSPGGPCATQRDLDAAPARMAIVAMGRYGGFELSYGSDADVLFVHEPEDGADPHEAHVVRHRGRQRAAPAAGRSRRRPAAARSTPTCARGQAGRRWCAPSTPTPPTTPSGRRSGRPRRCCARTPSSATWTCARRFEELIDPLRFPEDGISEDDVIEVRRIKARVDQERLPQGRRPAAAPQARPRRPRRHRVDDPAAADAARRRGCRSCAPPRPSPRSRPPPAPTCSSEDDAEILATGGGWSAGCATRSPWPAARAATSCPATPASAPRWRRSCGYPPGGTDEMVNDYLRATRRARRVVDRVFWE